jgi:hypothetical protein
MWETVLALCLMSLEGILSEKMRVGNLVTTFISEILGQLQKSHILNMASTSQTKITENIALHFSGSTILFR